MDRKQPESKMEIAELFIHLNNGHVRLPEWGNFFIRIGEFSQKGVTENSRTILALALPTRAFASPLISFGYITNRLLSSNDDDYEAYSEYLKTLPTGTPVVLRSVIGKKFKGILDGHVKINDSTLFAVKYEQGTKRYIKAKESKRIEIIDSEIVLPKTQKGRAIDPKSDFCAAILGNDLASSLISGSKLEVAIIGSKNSIFHEVAEQKFASQNRKIGTLQEILRVKDFQNSTKAYRSRVISDRIRATKVHSNIADPPLVIFDGAQGFLKWRGYWKSSNWVVVLDRTEYQFEPAVEQVNREYIQNRREENRIAKMSIDIPEGIEMTAFEVINDDS